MIRVSSFVLALVIVAGVASAQHRLLVGDYSKKHIALIGADGKVIWEAPTRGIHDAQLLPDGHILYQDGWTRTVEVTPDGKVVWEYDSAKANGNEGKKLEVHAIQRLEGGVTMIAESGTTRIIEVDSAGKLVREVKLKVKSPNAHRDTRLARKTSAGTYLVSHEAEGVIREYDATGKVVWEFEVPLFGKQPKGGHGVEAWGNQAFGVERLASGNTLIGTGNGHAVLEVTPEKKIVWQVNQDDLLPGAGIQLAWVCHVHRLPNGNTVIGNCHTGPKNPQIIEVTPEKKVVWTFHDVEHFGDATALGIVVDEPAKLVK
jgi:hypothetical protein